MSERSERTSKHGRYDGGASGVVIAHWCLVTSTSVSTPEHVMGRQ